MRAARVCSRPGCINLVYGRGGLCSEHQRQAASTRPSRNYRPNASRRGYDANWQKVRAEVLTKYGIPRNQWHRHAVDHRPPYNPAVEPDHRAYTLVPMLKANHNRKTARENGGFGNQKRN